MTSIELDMDRAGTAEVAEAFDVERIRADFPILHRDVYGKPLVYLDNAASAQKPRAVLDAIQHAYAHEFANVHRGLHYLSNTATAAYESARETVARFINAGSHDEIIFTRNATEAINLVAQSFGGEVIGAGDEIVLTIMEHHSNIVPWHFHRERNGAVLKWAPVNDQGELQLDELEKLLGPRTKMLAITHMSNVLGTIVPIKEIVAMAHARGIPVLLDGAQGAVHLQVDVQDLDCDFYVFTGHKLYGPTGVGVLYAKKAYLEAMPPYQGGGEMIETVSRDHISYGKPPYKFEAGTPAIVQVIGLAAAIDYVTGVGREAVRAHEDQLLAYAQQRLAEIDGLRMIGTAPNKGSIVSFEIEGTHPHDVSTIIDRSGIALRAGHHCAEPLMDRFGVTATCRASFAMYNTVNEVDALVEALIKARGFFS